MLRAVLIHNPAAGSSRQGSVVDDICSILGDGGVEVRAVPTEAAGHATEIARQTARSGVADWVLSLGGDGTLREVAKGLLGSEIALAPLSAGTTNVVARSLGLSIDPRQAARELLDATSIDADVGLCGDEPFLMQVTLGLDAAIMAGVPGRLKRVAGRAAVALSGLWTWAHYPFPPISYATDGEPGTAYFVAACNIAHYAGQFLLAPQSGFETRRLDLVTFHTPGRLAMLRFVLRLALGKHPGMRGLTSRPIDQLVLPAPLGAPLQLDGDPLELEAPLRVRLADQRIRLLAKGVPRG